MVMKFNDDNFKEEVLESKIPVLVDFWASWCPPCKMVEPIVEELAYEYSEKVKIGKLNVDQNPKTVAEYNIYGVPTFILFNEGKIVQRRTGAQTKAQLKDMLKEL
jgi:thioredoxin 1